MVRLINQPQIVSFPKAVVTFSYSLKGVPPTPYSLEEKESTKKGIAISKDNLEPLIKLLNEGKEL